MRTSKNVQACRRGDESSISLPSYAFEQEQENISPSLLMDMMQISCWRKKDKIELKRGREKAWR